MSITIRNSLEREDWAFLRSLCARTGKSGDPIDRSRWPFFGEQWIGPYEKLRPIWSYVASAAKVQGPTRRLGYLTGCPDTRGFEREKRWLFDGPLALRAKLGAFVPNPDTERFLKRFLHREKSPEECFNPERTRAVLEEYPAHLHVNLEAEARGRGVGRALVDRYRADLLEIGIHGIHVYCGDKPRPFYLKTGFIEMDRIEYRPAVFVYRLGSRF